MRTTVVLLCPLLFAAPPRRGRSIAPLRRGRGRRAGALALASDGRTVAVGRASLRPARAARAGARSRAGSITKASVATLVLQLAREQRLSLDDPVEKHLPGLVRAARRSPCDSSSTTPAASPSTARSPRSGRSRTRVHLGRPGARRAGRRPLLAGAGSITPRCRPTCCWG